MTHTHTSNIFFWARSDVPHPSRVLNLAMFCVWTSHVKETWPKSTRRRQQGRNGTPKKGRRVKPTSSKVIESAVAGVYAYARKLPSGKWTLLS